MFQKNIFSILVILAVVILISFFIGWRLGETSERKVWQEKLQQKQEELKALQSAVEFFYPPLPEKIYSLSGTVTEIQDKTIFLEAFFQVSQFPLPEGAELEKQNIKVVVTEQTKITELEVDLVPLLPEEEPLPEKTLSFEDIKTGDRIAVSSEENIKGKKEITASQIQVVRF